MARGRPYLTCRTTLLVAAGAALLSGCSPRAAVVGVGGAAVGAVSTVGAAAGSVVTGAGSAVSNAVGAGGGGAGSAPASDAAARAAQAAAAPPATTVRAFRGGVADCLDAIGTAQVASTLVSDGWSSGNEAPATPAGGDLPVAFARDGVRGSIVRGRQCSFAAEALVGPTSRALALQEVQSHVGSGVTQVAPSAQQGPCGSYVFDLDGRPARMDFTAAPGGDCAGAGAGITIRLI